MVLYCTQQTIIWAICSYRDYVCVLMTCRLNVAMARWRLFPAYSCPKGYYPRDLDYPNRIYWTFLQFGSRDSPMCAIRDTPYRCRAPKNKHWMTYKYGYGEFHIGKFTHFSSTNSLGGTNIPYSESSPSSSPTWVPVNFAVRAAYFRVRGVTNMTIDFQGDISQLVSSVEFCRVFLSATLSPLAAFRHILFLTIIFNR